MSHSLTIAYMIASKLLWYATSPKYYTISLFCVKTYMYDFHLKCLFQ